MTKRALAYCLALLLAPLAICGQTINGDTIVPERVVVKCPSYGMTFMNNLDTYLSGYEFTGLALQYSRENFRDARTGDYRWKYQTILCGSVGYATLGNNAQLTGLVEYNWGGYHPFAINNRLKLLAGAQIQAEGGALYMPSNGNNPVSVKLRTAIAASGMAIYHIPVKSKEWVARYQIDIPLAGIMFAPEYGQSYYEIFGLGHTKGIVSFAHPFNSPSMRHTLSLDIPLSYKRHSTTLRIAYTANLFQSDINDTRCHIYRNAFTIGFVKTLFKVKEENSIKAYSPY